MSLVLFTQLGVDGKSPYQKGDWVKIATHTDTEIRGFFGPYRWLSNIELCSVRHEGVVYPSSENAYKAARVFPEHRAAFTTCAPVEAMALAEGTPRLRSEIWDQRKVAVMKEILINKFRDNFDLGRKLIATKDAYLEERLWWKDTFWGYDVNLQRGENQLGILLMEVRALLKDDLIFAHLPKEGENT